ncbi:hypothetical protein HYH03_014310 [Edaphochlamys debaryana]|uniref:Uncharacterized protein n=1 Tax=Edaphochlamys debaryana TaxID=47281 RepID=A0A835XP04_9CHLO|nr:hypothetical protein HYH03_014310 [Edaphochlamys debaryana]|eukprot:KAG2487064.1 hypothetical protein HYH03_014310 [Edaphochlamys debaryana]
MTEETKAPEQAYTPAPDAPVAPPPAPVAPPPPPAVGVPPSQPAYAGPPAPQAMAVQQPATQASYSNGVCMCGGTLGPERWTLTAWVLCLFCCPFNFCYPYCMPAQRTCTACGNVAYKAV